MSLPNSVKGCSAWLDLGVLSLEDPPSETEDGAPADPNALCADRVSGVSALGSTTTTGLGKPYFVANSKSRSSCAGTAIIAPVPYSIRTKLPTQMGGFSLLKGLMA